MAKNKMPKDYRIREFNVESKIDESGEGKRFLYGMIPYNSESVLMYGVREVITKTAFTKTLNEATRLHAFVNHNSDKVIGSIENNTLTFENTDDGLFISIELPNTQDADYVYEMVSKRYVSTMSFGFSPIITDVVNGVEYLREVKLYEVSFAVPMPAYEATSSMALTRSFFNQIKETRHIDIETLSNILSKEELNDDDKTSIKNIVAEISAIYSVREDDAIENKAAETEPDTSTQLKALETIVALENLI